MGKAHAARFSTRRDTEMVIERLVQEHGVDRGDLFIHPAGLENTAGNEIAGSDSPSGEPSTAERHDAALNGAVLVSAETDDEETLSKVRGAFREFGATEK